MSLRIAFGTLLIGLLSLAPARAVLIDTFDNAQSVLVNSSTPTDSSSVTGTGIIGGEREVMMTYNSGPNDASIDIDAGGSSVLNFSTGADTLGEGWLVLDGIGSSGLGGVDLTDGGALNGILLRIPFDDLPIDIELVALSLTGSSSVTVNLPGGIFTPVDILVPFNSFGDDTGTGADPTDLNAIELHINPLFPATDFQLDFIESTFIVPEPSTFLLAAIGLVGLLVCGWKRRRM